MMGERKVAVDDDDEGKQASVTSKDNAADVADFDVAELRCGYGTWRPKWLQVCNNSKVLLAAICFFTLIQGWTVLGIVNVNTATIERRFDMRSSEVAWITSSYDISAGILGIILGYLAGFVHKGRIMSIGAAFMCAGGCVMLIPHFANPLYPLGATELDSCDVYGNQTDASCGDTSSGLSNYLYVFILGQLLHSVGGVSIYTVGLTYIDDNVKPDQTALYIGIKYCFAALGPALAFIGGGSLLNLYVDIGRVDMDEIDLGPGDPGWVGAWWIGFIVTAVGSALACIFLACFAHELPGSKALRSKRRSESHKGAGDLTQDERSAPNIARSVGIIITNPTWVFVSLAAIVESAAVNAVATFLPKLIQFQFTVPASTAALAAGIVIIPGAAGGHLLGGIIPRCFSLRVRGMLVMLVLSSVVGILLSGTFLIRCDMADIAGVNVPYFNSNKVVVSAAIGWGRTTGIRIGLWQGYYLPVLVRLLCRSISLGSEHLIHTCNYNCSCTTSNYSPICGADNVVYFSPCHAGCHNAAELEDGNLAYESCTCIDAPANVTAAHDGMCEGSCTIKFAVFMLLFLCILLANFMSNIAGHVVTIRCVPMQQRGFAYGLQSALIRFLGNVPGPIILGLIFDGSCLVWQDKCGRSGACWIYDTVQMGNSITIAFICIKAFSLASFLLSFLLYKPPPDEVIVENKVAALSSNTEMNDCPSGSNEPHISDCNPGSGTDNPAGLGVISGEPGTTVNPGQEATDAVTYI